MARISFRSTTVTDEPALRELLQEAHGLAPGAPMFEGGLLYWKYWQPWAGWPGSRSYVLTRDELILAHAAIVPAVCNFGNGRLNVLHVIDWAARAQARGAGKTLMQHIGTLADAIVTSDGAAEALRLLPYLGFANSNTVVSQYVRPIRPLLYLTGADAPGWRRAARCVRNTLWVLRTPSAGQHARRARPLAAAEVTASAIPWPAPKYGTAVLERSALGMRYWLQCPATPMELCAVEHGSEVEGYFVLAFAPGQARLADCWLESAEPAAWEALVQLAVRQAARHSDVAELVAISSEPLLAGALERCGFHARGSRPLLVRTSNGVRLPSMGIRVQMLDNDAAYRHNGARLFWA